MVVRVRWPVETPMSTNNKAVDHALKVENLVPERLFSVCTIVNVALILTTNAAKTRFESV